MSSRGGGRVFLVVTSPGAGAGLRRLQALRPILRHPRWLGVILTNSRRFPVDKAAARAQRGTNLARSDRIDQAKLLELPA